MSHEYVDVSLVSGLAIISQLLQVLRVEKEKKTPLTQGDVTVLKLHTPVNQTRAELSNPSDFAAEKPCVGVI